MPIHRAGCAGQEEVGSRVGSAPLSRWTEASTGPRVSLPAELSAKPIWMSYRSEPAVSRGLISVPRGPLWKSHSVQCSSVVTLGCAVALLDTRVSGDGPGGLQLRDGFCLVSFLRSRKSTPCWVEPVKPSPGS